MAETWRQIIELADRSGIPNNPTSTVRPGAVTATGKPSWHASGRAVDFFGHNQDRLASFFMKVASTSGALEVFHYSEATGTWYGMSKGKPVDPIKNKRLVDEHKNHVHVAMSEEQVGPGSILEGLKTGVIALDSLISDASGVTGLIGKMIPSPANVTQALTNVGNAMGSVAQSALSVGELATHVTKLFMPTNVLRGAAFLLGLMFILIGIWFLAREVRESTS